MSAEMGVTSARCIIFETARVLEKFILPSKVRCLILHTFKMFPILLIFFKVVFLLQCFIKRDRDITEVISNTFESSITEFLFLIKNLVSSAYAV